MTTIKQGITPNTDLLLATNHRFFVRYTILAVFKVILTTIFLSVFAYIMMGISASLVQKSVYAAEVNSGSLGLIFFIIVVLFVYIIYVLTQIAKVFTLHKKITDIEKENIPDAFLI